MLEDLRDISIFIFCSLISMIIILAFLEAVAKTDDVKDINKKCIIYNDKKYCENIDEKLGWNND